MRPNPLDIALYYDRVAFGLLALPLSSFILVDSLN